MKKIILLLSIVTTALFSANQLGCVETRLNATKSLYDCAHGTFEATFEFDRHTENRSDSKEPIIKKIAEAKAPIKQYINRN